LAEPVVHSSKKEAAPVLMFELGTKQLSIINFSHRLVFEGEEDKDEKESFF